MMVLETPRLLLRADDPALLRAELASREMLAQQLGAEVPDHWPPGEYDEGAMRFFLDLLEAGGPSSVGWYGWHALLKAPRRRLVAAGGFFGPPDLEGMVEVGYSVIPDCQGLGLGSEMVEALARWATMDPRTRSLRARTQPDNVASRRLLTSLGFTCAEAIPDPEDGSLTFWRGPFQAPERSAPMR